MEREDQLAGREPVTAVLATSNVTKEVMEDHEEGRVPVTEVEPLTLR